MESNPNINWNILKNVPSLSNIVCRSMRPLCPFDEKRNNESNESSFWSCNDDSNSFYESSEDTELEEDILRGEEEDCNDITKNTEERIFVLKSPELQVIMREEDFLNHANEVLSGAKRLHKNTKLSRKCPHENSQSDDNETSTVLEETSVFALKDRRNNEVISEGNLKRQDANILEANENSGESNSIIMQDGPSQHSENIYCSRKNELNTEERKPSNMFENEHYCKKSVFDLIKYFESIHFPYNQKQSKNAKVLSRLPFEGGGCP